MLESDLLTVKPIGVIFSPFKQKFTTPRQSGLVSAAHAEIHFNRKYVQEGSLVGLKDFSHIWILFHFHKNKQTHNLGKVKPPLLQGAKMGVFATRSPHRPNPIGLSLVKLENVDLEQNSISVSGADLIDGTPILDIKPYLADHDFAPRVAQGWTETVDKSTFVIDWTPEALAKLDDLHVHSHFQELVSQTLRFDTRNRGDRNKPDKVYKCHIEDWDVTFQFLTDAVLITDIHLVQSTQ